MEELLRKTVSICPECMNTIPARLVVDDGNIVYMRKTCDAHGDFEDIISRDSEHYKWKNGFADSLDSRFVPGAPTNVELQQVKKGCPYDCGLCTEHKSAANLVIMDITNRCNLNCPICFANSNRMGYIVEYEYEEVVKIMEYFINQKPYHAVIAQFSGGEPTLHPRIVDLIKKAWELGFTHTLLNTNGIRMAKSLDFCKQLAETGTAIYLSFDGVEPDTYKKIRGHDLSKIKRKVIENCRAAGLKGIQLVVTIAKGQNDHEVGAILDFARENNDVVCGVVYQPVSLCGRVTMEDLREMRYVSSDLTAELRRVTDNVIDNFYPLGFSNKFTNLMSWFAQEPGWAISAHDDCGWATYVQIDKNGEWKSFESYVDLVGLVKWSNKIWDMVQRREIPKPSQTGIANTIKSAAKSVGLGGVVDAINEFNDKMTDLAYRQAMKAYFLAGALKYLKNPNLKEIVTDKFYQRVAKFIADPILENSENLMMDNGLLFIGCMHFQDAYNIDTARVQQCVVHYGVLDPDRPGEDAVLQIPFCTYNTIHRDIIEKKWGDLRAKKIDKTAEQHHEEVEQFAKELENK